MELSDAWKCMWPISSTFAPPLLVQSNPTTDTTDKDQVGPLSFNPSSEKSLIQLVLSHSSPFSLLFPPLPRLSVPKFLSSSRLHIPSSVIDEQLTSSSNDDDKHKAFTNSLQLLRFPQKNVVFAFFPSGDNLEKIGFVVISVKDSIFDVKCNYGGNPFHVSVGDNIATKHHRILKLLINPIDDFEGNSSSTTIGYMLVVKNYSIYWYSIKVNTSSIFPVVEFMGIKKFITCVVHACWSPHILDQGVVLLENGTVFLFDLTSTSKNKEVKKVQVSWDNTSNEGSWLSCEFSWHPEILILAHTRAIFSLDLRKSSSKKCRWTRLLNIEIFTKREKDGFQALSKAGPDGFYFVVALNQLLLLCDIRKPMMPLLRWVHNIENINHLTVIKLSELRSNSKENAYKWASESGYCIILTSFLDCEFNLFCYGPDNNTKGSRQQFCAWGLTLHISLSGREICHCGTCLMREEFAKESLPPWIDWREKKDLIMGFAIFDKDLSSQLFGNDTFGGFSLVRLMFSGKLEVQKYSAAWEFHHVSRDSHKELVSQFEDNNFLYDFGEDEYDLPKRNNFMVFKNLLKYLSTDVDSDSIFDEDVKLDDLAMEFGQNNLEMYKLLRVQNLKFREGFELYPEQNN